MSDRDAGGGDPRDVCDRHVAAVSRGVPVHGYEHSGGDDRVNDICDACSGVAW